MREYSAVFFRRAQDPDLTFRRRLSAATLAEALTTERPRPTDKTELPAWSPTTYAPTATRRSASGVTSLSCLVLDFDDGTPIDAGRDPWMGYVHIWHTTHSHTASAPRWRLVLPLDCDAQARHWPAVWAWAVRRAPTIDQKCKDVSRIYFLPCAGEDGAFAAGVHAVEGCKLLDVSRHEYHAPPPRRTPGGRLHRPELAISMDASARIRLGELAGGRLVGDYIRKARCPACGRASAWWPVNPTTFTGWMCEHRNSCDKTGKLEDYIND